MEVLREYAFPERGTKDYQSVIHHRGARDTYNFLLHKSTIVESWFGRL